MASVYKTLTKSRKAAPAADSPKVANRQRVLITSSRGITHRHRHLLQDLASILPHGRREPKFDSKKRLYELNELAQLYNCNNVGDSVAGVQLISRLTVLPGTVLRSSQGSRSVYVHRQSTKRPDMQVLCAEPSHDVGFCFISFFQAMYRLLTRTQGGATIHRKLSEGLTPCPQL
jgi:hypothetical protein